MMTTAVEVICRGEAQLFHLQPQETFQELINRIAFKFQIRHHFFALQLALEYGIAVDFNFFQRLRRQNMPFTLYVVFEPPRDQMQKAFGRLNFRQESQNTGEYQISFDQGQRERKQTHCNVLLNEISKKNQANPAIQYPPQHKINLKHDDNQNQKILQISDITELKVQCDICFAFPIQGSFYKCLVCQEFDLCTSCEQHYHHFHPLLQIAKIQHYPRQVTVLFSQKQEKYMRSKLEEQKATIKQIKRVFYEKDEQNSKFRQIDPKSLESTQIRAKNFAACLFESSL